LSRKQAFAGFGAFFCPENKRSPKKRSSRRIRAQDTGLRGGKIRPGGPKFFQGGSCPPASYFPRLWAMVCDYSIRHHERGQGGPRLLDFHTWYKYIRYRLNSAIYQSFFANFWSFFSLPPLPWKRLNNSAIFRSFLLFFDLFFRCPLPLEIFLPTPLFCAIDGSNTLIINTFRMDVDYVQHTNDFWCILKQHLALQN